MQWTVAGKSVGSRSWLAAVVGLLISVVNILLVMLLFMGSGVGGPGL